MTCSRRWAAILVAALALTATLAAWAARPDPLDRQRTIGYGQVRFRGLGPERWAQRWRQDHRQVLALRRKLAARLAPIVQLVIDFECVHRFEGAWTDTGAPYWGGLQFDRSFMATYGGRLLQARGTADHWTPAEQIATAIVAHASRGFEPWPNTARRCGLR